MVTVGTDWVTGMVFVGCEPGIYAMAPAGLPPGNYETDIPIDLYAGAVISTTRMSQINQLAVQMPAIVPGEVP